MQISIGSNICKLDYKAGFTQDRCIATWLPADSKDEEIFFGRIGSNVINTAG